jgi:hypothetical protein
MLATRKILISATKVNDRKGDFLVVTSADGTISNGTAQYGLMDMVSSGNKAVNGLKKNCVF